MNKLELNTQTDIQLELLLAKEQKFINAINNILIEIDKVCKEDMQMTYDQLLEAYEYSTDRLNALNTEMVDRKRTGE